MLRISVAAGAGVLPHIPALARLRRTVFREWPYLYDGTEEAEAAYARSYAACPGAAVVMAWDGAEAVGMSTCLPLADETPDVQAPFVRAGLAVAEWCYFGESVLLAPYRGQGAGVAFFERREAHARSVGCRHAAFCAVQRPADHPLRPAGAVPLDGFWRRRGYAPMPGMVASMRWRDVGEGAEVAHPMQFWGKAL